MSLIVILTGFLALPGLFAQPPRVLTLAEAEALAIRNHPRIVAAKLAVDATRETVRQNRASLAPIITGNLTAIGAEPSTTLGAGQLRLDAQMRICE